MSETWSRDLGSIPNSPGARVEVRLRDGTEVTTVVAKHGDGYHHLRGVAFASVVAWRYAR